MKEIKLVVITFVIGIFALGSCDRLEVESTDGLWLKMEDNHIAIIQELQS